MFIKLLVRITIKLIRKKTSYNKIIGATLIEYALLLSVILITVMVTMGFMGSTVSQNFSVIGSNLE